MTAPVASGPRSSAGSTAGEVGAIVGILAVRGVALTLFLLMALAEPFLAAILGILALGCFFVSVFFGFILHAPFEHRWFVLGVSVVCLMLYLAFRFAMLGLQRLMGSAGS